MVISLPFHRMHGPSSRHPNLSALVSYNSCLRSAIIIIALFLSVAALALDDAPATRTIATNVEVIVTGSNIPTAEEVTPHPVDIYRKDDISRLGVRSFTDFIQKLPAATGASLNDNNAGSGDGRTEINLRGILPKETLVLQDGRRLAPVGFAGDTVDLNTIPLGLIDHIDVLKDGASAIYGSDAVDGVFNVWLIHRFRGLELYSSYANTNLGFANDAAEETAYLLAGAGDDKTDLVIYAEVYNRAAIYARDANISHDADYVHWGGVDRRSGYYAGRVQGGRYFPSLNGGSLTPTPHAFPNVQNDPQYAFIPTLPREQQFFNFADLTVAVPPGDREYLYGSLGRKICDQYIEFFSDFKYARTFWAGDLPAAPLASDVFTDAAHPYGISLFGISVPIQNAFSPFTVPNYISPGGFDPKLPETRVSAAPPGTGFTIRVRPRATGAGPRTHKITTENYEFTGGLKGTLGEFADYFNTWNWESGFRFNEDRRLERFSGIVNNTALRAALLDTNPATAFNPFTVGPYTKSVIDRVFVTTNHPGTTSIALEDLKLSGDLFNVPAGPICFALGSEHRTEHASDRPDPLTASGQTTGASNFGPTTGSRDVWSTFWELRVPITSPALNISGLYSLELGYQERYDNFSDFGAAERPKLFFRWQPFDSALTCRATYSEAFHAPTLSDLFRSALRGAAQITDLLSPATDFAVVTLPSGNPSLQPETAYEWNYGAVVTPGKWWAPLEGLTFSADFYHIDLRGVTVQLDPQFLVNHEAQFPGQVIRGPSTGPGDPAGPIVVLLLPEQNLGRFIEEGWDYAAVYSFESSRFGHGDWGKVTATLNGTYLDRAVLQAVVGGPKENVVGKFGGGFIGQGAAGGSFTHNRLDASLFYDGPAGSWLHGLDTGLTVPYIGQYWDDRRSTFFSFKRRDPNDPTSGFIGQHDRKVREWLTIDWILNYTFNFQGSAALNDVPGYAEDGSRKQSLRGGKETTSGVAISTAEYRSCGWRAWLDNSTVTLGVNNVLNEEPPFVAGAAENGYDEATANLKGRTWYVALKKRF
jgi:iron complex outermembrane receptor protein